MDEGELLVNGRAFDPTHRYSLILDETVLDGNGMSGPDLPEGMLLERSPPGLR